MIPFLIVFAPLLCLSAPELSDGITVGIEGHHPGKGQFIMALFDSAESFDNQEDPAYFLTIDNQGSESSRRTIEFNDVVPGRYAMAVFQDLNMNGKLDKNWMGIPKEPYGFSGDGSYKWRPPSFDEAVFTVGDQTVPLTIRLVEW